jgi:hypothetical protein
MTVRREIACPYLPQLCSRARPGDLPQTTPAPERANGSCRKMEQVTKRQGHHDFLAAVRASGFPLILMSSWVVGGCVQVERFPSDIENTVALEPTLKFGVLQTEPEVRLLAGSLIGVEPIGSGVLLVTHHLPVVKQIAYPSFRPMETRPIAQFVLYYPGHIDPQGLRLGNKFIALAEKRDLTVTASDGVSRTIPYFVGRCLYIWKTGHHEISDLRDRYNQVYAPLEEDTYCTKATLPGP